MRLKTLRNRKCSEDSNIEVVYLGRFYSAQNLSGEMCIKEAIKKRRGPIARIFFEDFKDVSGFLVRSLVYCVTRIKIVVFLVDRRKTNYFRLSASTSH